MTDALYQALILEHAKRPHHRGDLPGATHAATVDNPLCGDIVTLRLTIQGDRIIAVAHEGHGCTLSIAAASMLADRLVGLDVDAARSLVTEFEAMVAGTARSRRSSASSARSPESARFARAARARLYRDAR